MIGVADDSADFTNTLSVVNVLDGGKLTSTDVLGCPHNPLQCLAVKGRAVSMPGGDAVRMLSVVPL